MGARALRSHPGESGRTREFLHLKLFSEVSNQNWEGVLSTRHFAGFVCAGVGVGAQRAEEGIGVV